MTKNLPPSPDHLEVPQPAHSEGEQAELPFPGQKAAQAPIPPSGHREVLPACPEPAQGQPEASTGIDIWTWSEVHHRDPSMVPETRALVEGLSVREHAEICERIRRSGGRSRPFSNWELARWLLGLCIWCAGPTPETSRSRYCGEGCRQERNRPQRGQVSKRETIRRQRALRISTRQTVQAAALSWLTHAAEAWTHEQTSAELGAFIKDLQADFQLLEAAAVLIPTGSSSRDARAQLEQALVVRP